MKQRINLLFWLLLLMFAASCAKQGFPSGGPQDKTPPSLVGATPSSETLNFREQSFYLEFDEYVTVKDADNNVLISPPMIHKPEFTTKGHGVLVKIKDTLQPNTTYLFQFKEAIADFNEGNLLPSLDYVFSTGEVLDSMSLSGKVVDALSGKPREEEVSVMLYEKDEDSVAVNENPVYVTRCDKEGRFGFGYIRPGRYKIVAFEDGDKNMRFGPTESIGFADNLAEAIYVPKPAALDSVAKDSAAVEEKGHQEDTLAKPAADSLPKLVLRIFAPRNEVQRITSSDFKRKGNVLITAQMPLANPQVVASDSVIWRLNAKRDSLTLWTLSEKTDSLRLVVMDSTGLNDTLKLRFHQPKKSAVGLATLAPAFMKVSCGATLNYFDSVWISFLNPIVSASQDSLIQVLRMSDSAMIHCPAILEGSAMRARIAFDFAPGEKYKVKIPAKMFEDLYGHRSDSLEFSAEVTKPEQYGTLRLTLSSRSSQMVVQLLDEKDTVLTSTTAPVGQDKVSFEHLKAGKYKVRAILDENANGRWDEGDYWLHRQPEKVLFYPKTLDIRENWEFEENWEIKDP